MPMAPQMNISREGGGGADHPHLNLAGSTHRVNQREGRSINAEHVARAP